jgi:hypothetical protein
MSGLFESPSFADTLPVDEHSNGPATVAPAILMVHQAPPSFSLPSDLEPPTGSAAVVPAILLDQRASGAGGTVIGLLIGALCANMDSSSCRRRAISLFLCCNWADYFFSDAKARARDLWASANCFVFMD